MSAEQSINQRLNIFIQLEAQARQAEDDTAFAFTVCNSTKQLLSYHQAIFWQANATDGINIKAISATAQINSDAPYIIWLKKFIQRLRRYQEQIQLAQADVPEKLAEDGQQFVPAHCLW